MASSLGVTSKSDCEATLDVKNGCSARIAPPIVREVACKTVLNRSALSEYSLNCYTGCTHGCVYCYARFMQRFHPHDEPWGAFVDVKTNAVEVLKRQFAARRRAASSSAARATPGSQSRPTTA